jgi:glycosyltransferase involved in cell wall biosynthesis
MRLMAGGAVSADDETTFMREMICSDELLDYIAGHCAEYIFCFLPYMFGTTYWGAQVCPERSWLMPCLHDEPYAHMAIYRPMFAQVHGLLFLSRPEMALAQRLYPIGDKPMYLVGAGVDSDYTGDATAFRRKFGIEAPFILYAGRKEAAKNVPLLLDYYRTYRRQTGADVKLVFVGGGALPARVGPAEGVYDLGRLARTDLFDAYAAALALCQPSRYESFSFVLMEAWVAGTPGLVYEECAVTTDFVRQANGGLYFADYAEFAACVNLLLAQPGLRKRLGQQGRAYVLAQFAWPVVMERYRCILQQTAD